MHVATKEVPKSKSVAVYVPTKTGTKCKQEKIFVNDDETQWIDFVETSAYLGSYVHTDLSDEEEIRTRISKALSMFGCLRRHLLSSKDVWNEVKRKIITGMLLPIVLDSAETWVVSAQSLKELKVAYNIMVRGCLRYSLCTTRKHRITIADMQDRLGIHPLEYFLDWRVLGYAGHVARMMEHRLPKQIMEGEVSGKARRGAPNKSHRTQRKECLQRKGISLVDWKDLAQNKNAWRILIKKESMLPCKQNRMYSKYEKIHMQPSGAK